jgi:hypothetical protein
MNLRGYRPGDRVEYVGQPVFDGIIDTGEIGSVIKIEKGWVFARWPRSGVHSVPLYKVRLLEREVTRTVTETGNEHIWPLLGEELPPMPGGKPRDPYMFQGCHPDIVERVWDDLGAQLPRDCRAQAKGTPVLADPATNRIFAAAHGTAYSLWVTPEDFAAAIRQGASTTMTWSGGSVTDLAECVGEGWIWGRFYPDEPRWLLNAYNDRNDTE